EGTEEADAAPEGREVGPDDLAVQLRCDGRRRVGAPATVHPARVAGEPEGVGQAQEAAEGEAEDAIRRVELVLAQRADGARRHRTMRRRCWRTASGTSSWGQWPTSGKRTRSAPGRRSAMWSAMCAPDTGSRSPHRKCRGTALVSSARTQRSRWRWRSRMYWM